jgi:hypothetical protein
VDRETFWNYMQRHWERTLHAEECLIISGDDVPVGESAVVISVCPLTHIRNRILIVQNHLAYSDYYLVQALASRKGMLGRCRYFVKKEIVKLPFFGWAFWVRSLPSFIVAEVIGD